MVRGMLPRILSALVAGIAIAYVVFLFLPWTEEGDEFSFGGTTGLEFSPGFFTFVTGVGLVLWEVLGVAGVRRTFASDSLVAFFLAAFTGIAGLSSIAHTKWGNPYPETNFDYAAIVEIPLASLLLAGGIAHLVLHILGAGASSGGGVAERVNA
jgi:hypothetical protein